MTTQEDKMLLIKDLSSRLPYAVHVQHISGVSGILPDISIYHMYDENDNIYDAICYTDFFKDGGSIGIEHFKPYLFPLSSMTEEQRKEFLSVTGYEEREEDCGRHTETYYYDMVGHEHNLHPNLDAIDWLNKNHFDYRGLIEKGLAIDATGKNIY